MELSNKEVLDFLWIAKTAAKGADLNSCIEAIPQKQKGKALGFFISLTAGFVHTLSINRGVPVDEVINDLYKDISENQ